MSESTGTKLVTATIKLILNLPLFFLQGLLICYLWNTFIIPTFGLPHLNIPIAIGINILVSYLTYQVSPSILLLDKEQSERYTWLSLVVNYFLVGSYFLVGWIVSHFL